MVPDLRPQLMRLLFLGLLLPLALTPQALGAGGMDLAELQGAQEEILRLEGALKQLKLQNELDLLKQQRGGGREICQPGEGIGTLRLEAVYGTNRRYFATLSYNSTTRLDAKEGDLLLCGERVVKISLDRVEVEKGQRRYRISGTVTSAPELLHRFGATMDGP